MIAETIQQQIGNRAFAMMGATNLVAGHDSLTFKIGRNTKKVTHVMVQLGASDLYSVRFYSVVRRAVGVVAEVSDVGVEQLREVLSDNTGLYLSL